MKVKVTDCRDCPAHWTNTEFPESVCNVARNVSFGFGGHHASVMRRDTERSIPEDCPLRKGPVTLELKPHS